MGRNVRVASFVFKQKEKEISQIFLFLFMRCWRDVYFSALNDWKVFKFSFEWSWKEQLLGLDFGMQYSHKWLFAESNSSERVLMTNVEFVKQTKIEIV